MNNVKFPLAYSLPNNSGVIVYPDAAEKFSDAQVIDGFVYAKYSGALILTESALPLTGPKRLSKLGFIQLLADPEYEAILTLAKTEVMVEAWYKKFEMATPEADGTSIDLDDPRTIVGIYGMCQMGIFNATRRDQILSGISLN